MLQDDTDAAVAKTLRMIADSKAGHYSNRTGPSRQAPRHQSGVLSSDGSAGIALSEMTSSTAAERSVNETVAVTDRRGEESTTAAAAIADDDVLAITRADTESGHHHIASPTRSNPFRTPLNKSRMLLIMFLLQAVFYVFFAITLAGVGAAYLYGIPAVISFLGSFVTVITVIAHFGLQVKEGRGSEKT